MEPARLDVISDAICPWCYIGKRQMERALAQVAGLEFRVGWRPFQLNPDMPPEGVDRATYRLAKFGSAERSAELDARITAAGEAVGLDFRFDRMTRTPNTVDAHRVIRLAGEAGVQDAVVERLFHAYFAEGRDIGDTDTLAGLAAEAGMDAAAVSRHLAGAEGRDAVLEEDAMARRAGLSGVPTFALDGHVLFSGAVPADTMAEALTKAHRVLRGN
jgi:predicted DsbA family dithiol-disulfide isomerase